MISAGFAVNNKWIEGGQVLQTAGERLRGFAVATSEGAGGERGGLALPPAQRDRYATLAAAWCRATADAEEVVTPLAAETPRAEAGGAGRGGGERAREWMARSLRDLAALRRRLPLHSRPARVCAALHRLYTAFAPSLEASKV